MTTQTGKLAPSSATVGYVFLGKNKNFLLFLKSLKIRSLNSFSRVSYSCVLKCFSFFDIWNLKLNFSFLNGLTEELRQHAQLWKSIQKNKWVTLCFEKLHVRPTEFFGTTGLHTEAKVAYRSHTQLHTLTNILSSFLLSSDLHAVVGNSPQLIMNCKCFPVFPDLSFIAKLYWQCFLSSTLSIAVMHLWTHLSLYEDKCLCI